MTEQESEAYRFYLTEAARCIVNNTARFAGGYEIKKSYHDMINPQRVDNRSGEEIIAHMKEKLKEISKEVD